MAVVSRRVYEMRFPLFPWPATLHVCTVVLVFSVLSGACGAGDDDDSGTDATPEPSPGGSSPTPEDGSSPTPDDITSTPEETVPLDGFGEISGACGVLETADLQSPSSELIRNEIDFASEVYSEEVLSEGGQILYNTDNAGGSSEESEIISFEVLYRCELAELLKTETEIDYDEEGSITDMLVEIDALKVGVSVTRAMTDPSQTYELEDAERVLTKKLEGIQESSANVSGEDAWVKQILHVIAPTLENADTMASAYELADAELLGDTIVVITVTDGEDAFIY